METVAPRPRFEKGPAPATDGAEQEQEPAARKSGEPGLDHPQARMHNEQDPEERGAIEANSPGAAVTGGSPGVELELQREEPTDYQRVLHELRRRLQQSLRYPEAARRKGIEGAVAIEFTLTTEGHAEDMVVSVSSGSRILDRAALRSMTDIFPYPDPPEAPLRFTIPVTYRLTGQR